MPTHVAYTNHIGHSSRDKHTDKSTTISNTSDLAAADKHNNHDYTTDDVDRMQSAINLDKKDLNTHYTMKDGKLTKVEGRLELEKNVREIFDTTFAKAIEKYNQKQIDKGHAERQIDNYIDKISEDKQQEVAVEGLIQFGSLEDWENLSDSERAKIVPLLLEALDETLKELNGPDHEFKLAGASIHLNEGSPHLHYVGVPIQYTPEAKNGLEVRVKKSAVFTKEVLGEGLQDRVRAKIEPKLKELFGWEFEEKKTGRNEDRDKNTQVNEILKEQIKQNKKELTKQTEEVKQLQAQKETAEERLESLKEPHKELRELEKLKEADKLNKSLLGDVKSITRPIEQDREIIRLAEQGATAWWHEEQIQKKYDDLSKQYDRLYEDFERLRQQKDEKEEAIKKIKEQREASIFEGIPLIGQFVQLLRELKREEQERIIARANLKILIEELIIARDKMKIDRAKEDIDK